MSTSAPFEHYSVIAGPNVQSNMWSRGHGLARVRMCGNEIKIKDVEEFCGV